ncbi:hypothetical protein IWX90DRAFT_166938 [Phyllosticta citrichinensis]|uniref:Uncharacterized protein n=1 Tax=Phyllosticta citrichinensis TaxID=1130410 RepID=A0ABR1Y0X9_9PEZI
MNTPIFPSRVFRFVALPLAASRSCRRGVRGSLYSDFSLSGFVSVSVFVLYTRVCYMGDRMGPLPILRLLSLPRSFPRPRSSSSPRNKNNQPTTQPMESQSPHAVGQADGRTDGRTDGELTHHLTYLPAFSCTSTAMTTTLSATRRRPLGR